MLCPYFQHWLTTDCRSVWTSEIVLGLRRSPKLTACCMTWCHLLTSMLIVIRFSWAVDRKWEKKSKNRRFGERYEIGKAGFSPHRQDMLPDYLLANFLHWSCFCLPEVIPWNHFITCFVIRSGPQVHLFQKLLMWKASGILNSRKLYAQFARLCSIPGRGLLAFVRV